MAGTIKGITIEIGGNTGPLDKALQGVNKTSRDLQGELKQVEKLLKLDPTNTELLAQKQKLLAESVDNTKSKLNTLKEAEKQVQQQVKEGKISEEQYRAFQREVANTEIKMKGLESQGKQTNEVLSDGKAIDNFKKIGVAAGAALATAGAAFAGMAKSALDSADELQKQADVTGLTAERLQELQYAGNNLGVELDTITGAQAKLTKSMAAAEKGTGSQAKAFQTLGINIKDKLTGHMRDANTVMNEAFTALGNVKNETERNQLAMALFGKSAMELNPLIKAGGDELNKLTTEAQKNGAVMSNEAVSGLDTFGDTLDNIKSSIMGAFGNALAGLLPKIQELISKIDMEKLKQGIQAFAEKAVGLLNFILENGGTITSLIVGIGAGFVAWNVASMVMLVVESIKKFQKANEGATIAQWALNTAQKANPIMLIVSLIVGLVAAIITLWTTNEDFRKKVIEIWNAIKKFFVDTFTAIKNFFVDTWNGIKDFFANTWDGIKGSITKTWDNIKQNTSKSWNEVKDNTVKAWDVIKNKVKENGGGIEGVIKTSIQLCATVWKKGFDEIDKHTGGKLSSILNSVKNIFKGIGDTFTGWKNKLVEIWNSIWNFKIPKIKLPHFSVSGSLNPLDWIKNGVPKLDVKWYDKGGIFNSPTLIGVGEKRPEFVGALEDLESIVRNAIHQENSGNPATIIVPVNLDGEVIAKVVAPYSDRINGKNVVLAGRSVGQ